MWPGALSRLQAGAPDRWHPAGLGVTILPGAPDRRELPKPAAGKSLRCGLVAGENDLEARGKHQFSSFSP